MAAPSINPSISLDFLKNLAPRPRSTSVIFSLSKNFTKVSRNGGGVHRKRFQLQCSEVILSEPDGGYETEEECNSGEEIVNGVEGHADWTLPPTLRRRRRYRRLCPGETKGITEEMRFVAMKLRNRGKVKVKDDSSVDNNENENAGAWEPSLEGFLKYLVDSKLVFSTIERIVDESIDVSYVYFRKTGLERADSISRDLKWFSEQSNAIPDPSNPGTAYAQYLEQLAEKNPPLFLCNFYNIYFSHIAGGQLIAKQASKKLLEGREMELFKWEGDPEDMLRGVREKLNALGEHWTREEKNKCLREVTKTFRFLEQIVRQHHEENKLYINLEFSPCRATFKRFSLHKP